MKQREVNQIPWYIFTDACNSLFVASTFIENKKELSMEHIDLNELFWLRKLTPRESYLLLTQLTAAVAFLHQRFLTLCQPISPDNVVACMDNGVSY